MFLCPNFVRAGVLRPPHDRESNIRAGPGHCSRKLTVVWFLESLSAFYPQAAISFWAGSLNFFGRYTESNCTGVAAPVTQFHSSVVQFGGFRGLVCFDSMGRSRS